MTINPIEIITVGGAAIGAVLAILQLRDRYRPVGQARIDHPVDGTEVAGRKLSLSGQLSKRGRSAAYWIAIQPCDTSAARNTWWPQKGEIVGGRDGRWSVDQATLGRSGELGERRDVGKMYIVGLFEVLGSAKDLFARACREGERVKLTSQCRQLHSIKVKRVRDLSDRAFVAARANRPVAGISITADGGASVSDVNISGINIELQ